MKLITLAVFTLSLFLVGCANHTAGLMASSSNSDVRIDNASFNREVSIGDIRSRYSGDIMQGSALISSKVATDLRLQYKFTWYDNSGFTLEDEANSWKSLKLHGKQQLQVHSVAPNAQASRFEVYVRKAFSH